MADLLTGSARCACEVPRHRALRIAITGGPGAGKTAVLQMAARTFCAHVAVLPEAAGIVFGGGFPRSSTPTGRRASQRAIYFVQREVEAFAVGEGAIAVALCDRGTLDGAAYWPGPLEAYVAELGTDLATELARYDLVIHLRTPSQEHGYDRSNALRIESAEEAARIDARIAEVWSAHPNRVEVPSSEDFIEKARHVLAHVRSALPLCCVPAE